MCFNEFNIFFFSINTFHNHHPSLNACVSNFIFWVVPSRYLDSNAPPKVVTNWIFAHSAPMAVWNPLLERFLVVWRPQMRPERQPQGRSTNHDYIPIQSQFGLWDSFLTRFQAFFRWDFDENPYQLLPWRLPVNNIATASFFLLIGTEAGLARRAIGYEVLSGSYNILYRLPCNSWMLTASRSTHDC